MGYWSKTFSTVFRGVGAMSFKQRWNARKAVNELKNADIGIQKRYPTKILAHRIVDAMGEQKKILKSLSQAAKSCGLLIYEAEVQEDSLIKSISKVRSALASSKVQDPHLQRYEAQLLEGMVQGMKLADREERELYKDVMAIIEESEKGDMVLRNLIRTRFQTLDTQTILAKWAARSEVKTTEREIDRLNQLATEIEGLKGKDAKIRDKAIAKFTEQASGSLKQAFHESFLIRKRALIWTMKVLYDLYTLKEIGAKYVGMHYMPLQSKKDAEESIDGIIKDVLKDFRIIAQGFRIMINHLESVEKELSQTERRLAA